MSLTTPEAPTMPYRVEPRPVGVDGSRLCKFHGSATAGEWMSDDEVAVWEYVQWLEAENRRLMEEMEAATAPKPKRQAAKP